MTDSYLQTCPVVAIVINSKNIPFFGKIPKSKLIVAWNLFVRETGEKFLCLVMSSSID